MLIFGIAVMGISALANWYVSHRLFVVAKESESIALESDAWHLRTDVYTSLGVFAGLVLIRLTGNPIFDPLFALGVAVVIMKAAYDLTKRSLSDLIDHSIPETDEKRIKEIICEHSSIYAGFHDLKTRRSGGDLHRVPPRGARGYFRCPVPRPDRPPRVRPEHRVPAGNDHDPCRALQRREM